MKIYEVSCRSDCGTYFASYLQTVCVIAPSKERAIEIIQESFRNTGESFIRDDPKTWYIEELRDHFGEGVFYELNDSDY